jgi:hypothetical protein
MYGLCVGRINLILHKMDIMGGNPALGEAAVGGGGSGRDGAEEFRRDSPVDGEARNAGSGHKRITTTDRKLTRISIFFFNPRNRHKRIRWEENSLSAHSH